MAIDFLIDHQHRLVLISMHDTIGIGDIVTCANKIMSISDVATYNAIADLSKVKNMPQFSSVQVNRLAMLFLGSYPFSPVKARLAMVAGSATLNDMARSFEAACDSDSPGNKRVGVFRTLEGAAGFLQLPDDALAGPLRYLRTTNC